MFRKYKVKQFLFAICALSLVPRFARGNEYEDIPSTIRTAVIEVLNNGWHSGVDAFINDGIFANEFTLDASPREALHELSALWAAHGEYISSPQEIADRRINEIETETLQLKRWLITAVVKQFRNTPDFLTSSELERLRTLRDNTDVDSNQNRERFKNIANNLSTLSTALSIDSEVSWDSDEAIGKDELDRWMEAANNANTEKRSDISKRFERSNSKDRASKILQATHLHGVHSLKEALSENSGATFRDIRKIAHSLFKLELAGMMTNQSILGNTNISMSDYRKMVLNRNVTINPRNGTKHATSQE